MIVHARSGIPQPRTIFPSFPQAFCFSADKREMDISLSTQLSQAALSTELNALMVRKGVETQQVEGQNVLALMASAAPTFTDPALGSKVNLTA